MAVCGRPEWQAAFLFSGEVPDKMPAPGRAAKKAFAISSRGLRPTFRRWMLRPFPAGRATGQASCDVVPKATGAARQPVPEGVAATGHEGARPEPTQCTLHNAEERDELVRALCWASGANPPRGSIPVHVSFWLEDIDPEEAADVLRAYRAQSQEIVPATTAASLTESLTIQGYRSSKPSYRLALGKALAEWLATDAGKAALSQKRQWSLGATFLGLGSGVASRGVRRFLARCVVQWKASPRRHGVRLADCGRRSGTPPWVSVPFTARRRASGGQGRPPRAPELSHALYQWFVDIRLSVAGKISGRRVLTMARLLLQSISLCCISDGVVPDPPVLNVAAPVATHLGSLLEEAIGALQSKPDSPQAEALDLLVQPPRRTILLLESIQHRPGA